MIEWRAYNECYLISNYGHVKSLPRRGTSSKEKILIQKVSKTGYHSVNLNGKWKLVHRLVAELFIPNTENKKFVDHIDFNKSNNIVQNLRWVSMEENNRLRYLAGRANQYTLYGRRNKIPKSI